MIIVKFIAAAIFAALALLGIVFLTVVIMAAVAIRDDGKKEE